MTKLFDWLLPQWAKNPLLDYELSYPSASDSRRGFVLQLLALASLLAGAAIVFATTTRCDGKQQKYHDARLAESVLPHAISANANYGRGVHAWRQLL